MTKRTSDEYLDVLESSCEANVNRPPAPAGYYHAKVLLSLIDELREVTAVALESQRQLDALRNETKTETGRSTA